MDCLDDEFVCSLEKENGLGYYRIHTVWKSNSFRINIASKDGSWTGEMTPENVQRTCDELKIDVSKYLDECKEALTTDDGKKGYSYAIDGGSFTWKKMIDEDSGIKLKMGSILVQPTSFVDVIQNMLELSLKCKKNLQMQVNHLTEINKKNTERVSILSDKLDELCNAKNIMETDLYQKFILLLNNKKTKIKELQRKEHSMKYYSRQNANKSNIISKTEGLSESNVSLHDEYEIDTDEEPEIISENRNKKMEDNLQPSTSCIINHYSENYIKNLHGADCNNAVFKSSNTTNFTASNSDCHVKHLDFEKTDFKDEHRVITNVKNSIEGFPSTKTDILDYFFGSDKDGAK